MKKCNECKEYKSLDAFNNSKKEKDGKQYKCKACTKKLSPKWNKLYDERNPNKRVEGNKYYNEYFKMVEGYGVYMLIHIPTQKYYIGEGQLYDRRNNHIAKLKNGKHKSPNVQNHYNEDPCVEDWEFRVIKKWDTHNKKEGRKLESKLINWGFDNVPKEILNERKVIM